MRTPSPIRRPPACAPRRAELALLAATALLTATHPLAAQRRGAPPGDSARGTVPPGMLVGTVVDAVGKPMAEVEVYLAKTDRSVRTDPRGVWRIADPPAGAQVVVARSIGYVPFVREVVVGSAANDSVHLLLRRYPRTLPAVEITARSNAAAANAEMIAERLMAMRAGAGRLYTRDQILEQRPFTVAELVQGVPGLLVQRGRSDDDRGAVIATTTRSGVGILNTAGTPCQLQFYLDGTPIENDGVGQLDPMTFRSVEVYPNTVLLPGLPMRPDKCGAIIINTLRR